MKQLKWEYTLAVLFLACSVLILTLMLIQAIYSDSYREQILQDINNVQSSGFTLQEVPSTQFKEHAIIDYHEMVERPLFFTGRIPIVLEDGEGVEAVAVEVKPPEEFSMALIGIIDTPAGVYALFHNPKAKADEPKFKRLKQDQEINGWKIKEIKHDRVIISADKSSNEILLAKPRVHKKVKPKRSRKTKTNPFKQKIKKAE
jgi:type II secretory pathway component PulC